MVKKIKGFSVGLKGFGSNFSGKSLGGQSLEDISFISVAPDYSVALDSKGKIKGWGKNISGVLNLNNFNSLGFKSVSAGYDHCLGIIESRDPSSLPNKRTFIGNSPIGRYSCFTGYRGSWSSPVWLPKTSSDPFSGFAKNVTITGFFDAGLIIKKYPNNQTLIEDRRNFNYNSNYISGSFYLNPDESYYLDVTVPCIPIVLTGVGNNYWRVSAAAFEQKIDFISEENVFTGWGADYLGQVSAGFGLKNLKKVSAGNGFSLALFQNGTVTGWGSNHKGQISNLNTLSNITDISAGTDHSLFLNSNGVVFSRGSNDFGQVNINLPPDSYVIQISAGRQKTAVLYKNTNSSFSRVFATGNESFKNLTYLNSIQSASHVDAGYNGFIIIFENGLATGIGSEYCGEFDFREVKNALYGFNGDKFSQIIYNKGVNNTNFLNLSAGFNFEGKSDQVIKTLNIDTAINKKIEKFSNINFLKKEPSLFSVGFYTGLVSNIVSNSYLKISGSSLKEKSITGRNFTYKYLNDPFAEVINGESSFTIDDWTTDVAFSDLSYKNQVINSGYIDPVSFSAKDPFLGIKFNNLNSSKENYFFKVYEKKTNNGLFLDLNNEPNRFVFSWVNLPSLKNEVVDFVNKGDSAFLIYETTTGTNFKNIFSYSLEFESNIYSPFYDKINLEERMYSPLVGVEPLIKTGFYNFLNDFLVVCLDSLKPLSTLSDKKKVDILLDLCPPAEGCVDGATGSFFYPGRGRYTTNLPPSGEYETWRFKMISDFLSSTKEETEKPPSVFREDTTLRIREKTLSYFDFASSSGVIVFGDFYSGDRIIFEPYTFDYTGVYRSFYSKNPTYQKLSGFNLEFKKDFNTPEELFEKLKVNFLNYKNYFLWYPNVIRCESNDSGFFEKIEKPFADVFYIPPKDFWGKNISDNDTGIWNKRIIGYVSNYFHSGGFNMRLEKNPRIIDSQDRNQGFKYLLPSEVSLYGSNDKLNWVNLHSSFNNNWKAAQTRITGLTVKYFKDDLQLLNKFSVANNYSGISSLFELTGSFNSTGSGFDVKDNLLIDPYYQPRNLFTMRKTGIKYPCPTCPPENYIIEEIVYFTGSGETCYPDCPPLRGPETASFQKISLATGWLIDYEKLNISKNELIDLNFNYFKVELKNFKPPNDFISSGLKPLDFFQVNSINFYSLEALNPMLGTELDCWNGGAYTSYPKVNFPVDISGSFQYEIKPIDSGVKDYSTGLLVSGKLVGNSSGDYVKLNRISGRIISNSGFSIYTGKVYSTGIFCTGVSDWFYETSSKKITNLREFCSFFESGSGYLSGQYLRIKPSVALRDLAVGRWLNPFVDVNFETGIFYSGFFYAQDYVSGYTGYIKIPYFITGETSSGFIDFNKEFNGSSFGSLIRLDDAVPTGYYTASGWIKIHEGLLVENDFITLNNNTIFYNSNNENFFPPDYFQDFSSLCEIFTGELYSNLFNSEFEIDVSNKTILIKASPLGDSGNNITFNFASVSGGISGINGVKYDGSFLSGGKTFYQYISGTGNYSYSLGISGYPITGFYYSNSGSGFVFGPVKTYQGQRDFTGVWSLATGESAFVENLFLVEGSGSLFSGTYNEDGLGTYPERLNIGIGYEDMFSLGGADIAVLTVFDKNYKYLNEYNNLITGSGVSIIIENY